jgi:alpha/beta superfamily hydrolase
MKRDCKGEDALPKRSAQIVEVFPEGFDFGAFVGRNVLNHLQFARWILPGKPRTHWRRP